MEEGGGELVCMYNNDLAREQSMIALKDQFMLSQ